MPVTQRDLDWLAARLLPDLYAINERDKYNRVTRRLTSLLHELESPGMNLRLKELAQWREKQATPLPERPSIISQPIEKPRMSITGLQHGILKSKLAEIKQRAQQRLADGVAKIDAAHSQGLARVDAEMDGVVQKINKEIDDQLQEFAEFTNGGPA